jgi:hypothetical protein
MLMLRRATRGRYEMLRANVRASLKLTTVTYIDLIESDVMPRLQRGGDYGRCGHEEDDALDALSDIVGPHRLALADLAPGAIEGVGTMSEDRSSLWWAGTDRLKRGRRWWWKS